MGPPLVILDLLMPDLNGFAVIATLRGDVRTRGIPIVFLTAKDLSIEAGIPRDPGQGHQAQERHPSAATRRGSRAYPCQTDGGYR